MGHHQIEDCSSYTALLLLISWYVYAIYGSCLLIEDNKDRHCYVSDDSYIPQSTIDPSMKLDYLDAAQSAHNVGGLGLGILLTQGVLMCLAGCHRVLAWLAGMCLFGQLWYFIDLHRVRYSHAGQVCFGDFINKNEAKSDVYLVSEGAFIRCMIIS